MGLLSMVLSLILAATLVAQEPALDRARLASQAQSLAEQLPNLIGTEVLQQRSISYSTRMRIRLGEGALRPIAPKIREREIVSELGYALRGKEKPVWFELRKVISVDGKTVTAPKAARERLAFGLQSDDERARLKMLEEFTHYGLDGIATDYGLALLMFRFGDIDKLEFEARGSEFVGADRVLVVGFRAVGGEMAVTVFDGNNATRQPAQGTLWLRQADMRPLRIQVLSTLVQNKTEIVDEGVIEYMQSKFGCALPTSVAYTRKVNGVLVVETQYRYQPFQKFGSDAQLKVTP